MSELRKVEPMWRERFPVKQDPAGDEYIVLSRVEEPEGGELPTSRFAFPVGGKCPSEPGGPWTYPVGYRIVKMGTSSRGRKRLREIEKCLARLGDAAELPPEPVIVVEEERLSPLQGSGEGAGETQGSRPGLSAAAPSGLEVGTGKADLQATGTGALPLIEEGVRTVVWSEVGAGGKTERCVGTLEDYEARYKKWEEECEAAEDKAEEERAEALMNVMRLLFEPYGEKTIEKLTEEIGVEDLPLLIAAAQGALPVCWVGKE